MRLRYSATERLSLIHILSEVKAAGNVILFIAEIHTITSAGESEGAMNAGNILKPALSRDVYKRQVLPREAKKEGGAAGC